MDEMTLDRHKLKTGKGNKENGDTKEIKISTYITTKEEFAYNLLILTTN